MFALRGKLKRYFMFRDGPAKYKWSKKDKI